jgi:hypothetical protein
MLLNLTYIYWQGGGVLAPGSICSWFSKYFLNIVWNIKKLKKNFARSSQHFLIKLFHEKTSFFVLYIKRQILMLKYVLHERFFVFLHKTQKMSVFHKTWRAHRECRDVLNFFYILKMFYLVVGAYAPLSRIEIPIDDSFFKKMVVNIHILNIDAKINYIFIPTNYII